MNPSYSRSLPPLPKHPNEQTACKPTTFSNSDRRSDEHQRCLLRTLKDHTLSSQQISAADTSLINKFLLYQVFRKFFRRHLSTCDKTQYLTFWREIKTYISLPEGSIMKHSYDNIISSYLTVSSPKYVSVTRETMENIKSENGHPDKTTFMQAQQETAQTLVPLFVDFMKSDEFLMYVKQIDTTLASDFEIIRAQRIQQIFPPPPSQMIPSQNQTATPLSQEHSSPGCDLPPHSKAPPEEQHSPTNSVSLVASNPVLNAMKMSFVRSIQKYLDSDISSSLGEHTFTLDLLEMFPEDKLSDLMFEMVNKLEESPALQHKLNSRVISAQQFVQSFVEGNDDMYNGLEVSRCEFADTVLPGDSAISGVDLPKTEQMTESNSETLPEDELSSTVPLVSNPVLNSMKMSFTRSITKCLNPDVCSSLEEHIFHPALLENFSGGKLGDLLFEMIDKIETNHAVQFNLNNQFISTTQFVESFVGRGKESEIRKSQYQHPDRSRNISVIKVSELDVPPLQQPSTGTSLLATIEDDSDSQVNENEMKNTSTHSLRISDLPPLEKPIQSLIKAQMGSQKPIIVVDNSDSLKKAQDEIGALGIEQKGKVAISSVQTRSGKPNTTLVQISTECSIYLLDTHSDQRFSIIKLLSKVCENPHVEKVFHGRSLQKFGFLEEFEIQMTCVTNVQVLYQLVAHYEADMHCTTLNSSKCRSEMDSNFVGLNELLKLYSVASEGFNLDTTECFHRPLSPTIKLLASWEVMNLLELRETLYGELNEKILLHVQKASAV